MGNLSKAEKKKSLDMMIKPKSKWVWCNLIWLNVTVAVYALKHARPMPSSFRIKKQNLMTTRSAWLVVIVWLFAPRKRSRWSKVIATPGDIRQLIKVDWSCHGFRRAVTATI